MLKPTKEVKADDDNGVSTQPAPKKRDQEYIIEKADIDEGRFGKTLKLYMRGKDDGLCRPRNICVEHRRPEMQEAGQAEIERLADACDLQLSGDLKTADFVGRCILITADNHVQRPWKPAPSVARSVKFVPKFSVVPKAQTTAREMAKVWAAKFNDDVEDAA
ncbi:hypothetical protein [Mesorhizobium silamurunense]|uniref:hypothetical protein n=1 Tax=Mesorhizobium silamurunense TaxID=499528 RepID=UPI00177CB0E9|nr:hypothetical protein [Mesorhizobium silamurunense]